MKKNCFAAVWTGAGALLVCLALRVYQIVGCTDMTSGFLYHDSGFGGWGYYLALALAAVALAVCGFTAEKHGQPESRDIVDARAAVLGFGLLLTGICALYDGITELSAFTPSKIVAGVDFVFGAAMTVSAFVTLYKKEFRPGLGFSYCTGAMYFMMRGVGVFLDRMAIATVPEYLIECLSDILLGAFFMLAAKFLSGNGAKHTACAITVFGGASAVLSLSGGLGIILAQLTAPAEIAARITGSRWTAEFFRQEAHGRDAYMMTYLPWVNIAAGLLAAAFVVVLALKRREVILTEEVCADAAEAAEEPDEAVSAEEPAADPDVPNVPNVTSADDEVEDNGENTDED